MDDKKIDAILFVCALGCFLSSILEQIALIAIDSFSVISLIATICCFGMLFAIIFIYIINKKISDDE